MLAVFFVSHNLELGFVSLRVNLSAKNLEFKLMPMALFLHVSFERLLCFVLFSP